MLLKKVALLLAFTCTLIGSANALPAKVQAVGNTVTAATTNAVTATVTAGNSGLLLIGVDNNQTPNGISDNQSDTYRLIASNYGDSGARGLAAYYVSKLVGGSTTVTVTLASSGTYSILFTEFSSAGSYSVESWASAVTSSFNAATITTGSLSIYDSQVLGIGVAYSVHGNGTGCSATGYTQLGTTSGGTSSLCALGGTLNGFATAQTATVATTGFTTDEAFFLAIRTAPTSNWYGILQVGTCSNSSSNTLTCAMPDPIKAGDELVATNTASYAANASATTGSVSDSQSSTWLTPSCTANSGTRWMCTTYGYTAAAGADTITWTNTNGTTTANSQALVVYELTGFSSAPTGATAAPNMSFNVASLATPTVTGTLPHETLIYGAYNNAASALSCAGCFPMPGAGTTLTAFSYNTSGTYTSTVTGTGGNLNSVSLVSVGAAATAGASASNQGYAF